LSCKKKASDARRLTEAGRVVLISTSQAVPREGNAADDALFLQDHIIEKSMKRANRLIAERSPYLLQHAYNPVDWYPWGEEAFEKASRDEKPVFLSVGYSACHWCLVMERQSFEDEEVASLLNASFVPIKVDREERPDIDALYMKACRMITGSSGWPLTIIMTPDKKPFFAATYIPKNNSFGRVGLMELLPRIRDMWWSKRRELQTSADDIISTIGRSTNPPPDRALDADDLKAAYDGLKRSFDNRYGGFGSAPKFPSPNNLSFLFRYNKRSGDSKALGMALHTLSRMRLGGICDHVGGGFHRYAIDREWCVPHFEKMLYDQALIAMAYTEAWQITRKDEFQRTARKTLGYAIRDLRAPGGAFYSAESADSEGGEGAYYVWTMKDLRNLLSPEDLELVTLIFGIQEEGTNILYMKEPIEDLAARHSIDSDQFIGKVDRILRRLYDEREKRSRPKKDDKVLTDWNGLMIAALAKASRIFGDKGLLEAARLAAGFVLAHMRDGKGLFHSLRDEQEPVRAFADDYAFMIWGLLELYQSSLDVRYLASAVELNEHFMAHYWNTLRGCIMMTKGDDRDLPVRLGEAFDGSLPSANSVHMRNLLMISRITSETSYEMAANSMARAFAADARAMPQGHCFLLSAVDCAVGPSVDVIIAGDPEAEDTRQMIEALRKLYLPDMVILFRNAKSLHPKIDELSNFTKQCQSQNGKTTAYVCKGRRCLAPMTDLDEVIATLNTKG
jgi:uncharacterized protein YyaL (SSP411 family)